MLCTPVIGGSISCSRRRHPQRSLSAEEEHTACSLHIKMTHLRLARKRRKPLWRTLVTTVGSALAVLCLISTLAVAAEEGMEMTCVSSDGKGNCVVGKMPDGNDLVLVGSGLKVGEKIFWLSGNFRGSQLPDFLGK